MLKKHWFSFILICSFLFSSFLAFYIKHPIEEIPDSYSYDNIAINLATGHGYVDENYKPTMEREPLYPFFLALIYFIFGHNYTVVQFIQIILFLMTLIFVYKIATITFDKIVAKYALILTAFFPTLMNYPAYILSETLFTFLLAIFIFSCLKIYTNAKMIYYILSGFTFGALVICKCFMLLFVLVLFLWGVCFGRSFKKTILMIIICFAMILPWMYRNYVYFNTLGLRTAAGGALWGDKVQKLDYQFKDFKETVIFTISENLGKKMFPNAVDNPRDFLFKEDILVREKIYPELRAKGYTDSEIQRIMIRKIMKRPVKFLLVSTLDLLKMTQFSYLPTLNQPHIIENFKNFAYGDTLLSSLRAIFRSLAYFLILFSIIGMFISKSLWKTRIFLFIIIAYFNLLYSLIYGHGRYAVPLIPYYIILSFFRKRINEKFTFTLKV